jgi:alkylation response protein AidB-like acyl-CoA dehydrogenase
VWTSLAHWAQWCFVLARTDRDAPRHRGISYLLVPMDQPGIEIRPIDQITGDSEFNEVFFDGARTPADHVVGEVNGGWRVAMGTLAFERGALTLGQQLSFVNEWREIVARTRALGRADDPVLRQRLAQAWIELEIMRYTALRGLTAMAKGEVTRETSISKLFWGSMHRRLGELALDVLGPYAEIADAAPYDLSAFQRLFLYSRADTIYGGSNEIQRNVIGERVLGLPPEPKVI